MQTYLHHEAAFTDEMEPAPRSQLLETIKGKFFQLWPWLIGSTVVCAALAVLYLALTSPTYKIHATVLVQDDKKGTQFGDASLLQDFGLLPGKSNVDNEAEILKGRTILEEVVKNLQLNVNYAIPGTFIDDPITGSSPVCFRFADGQGNGFPDDTYTFTSDKTDVHAFTLANKDSTYRGRLNQFMHIGEGQVIVTANPGYRQWPAGQPLNISISAYDAVVQAYMKALTVEIPNKDVSVIDLTLEHVLPEKGERILNTMINTYMQDNVDDKNMVANSTMRFIDDRLALVTGELSGIETDIQGFKTTNKLTDIAEQSRLMLKNTSDYTGQQTVQEVQLSVVEGLEEFLKNSMNETRVVPSTIVMQEPSFTGIIQRYNELQLQRDKMLMSLTPQHPSVITADEQLHNLRLEMLSSIGSIKRGLQVSIGELKKRTNGFEGEMSKVPAKERIFLDYSRQQSIKQELYLFLLKKREETAITKSSNVADSRVIDQAKSEGLPFKPKKAVVVFAGLMAGMLLPIVVSLGKDALTSRINTLRDITDETRVPVLAEIGHNNSGNIVAVTVQSRSEVAEQFRALRTNLQYLLTGKNDKTIMITSSMGGEGKSFVSINLCMVLAMAGKKVIILEMDLRKPKITEYLALEKRGFSNFIISDDNDWSKWVQPSGIHENISVLSSGPIPPNPAELLLLPKAAQLFTDLKNHYDYVIIDTPPAGMVTDAEIIAPFADTTLYMVRHHVTFKQHISLIEKLYFKKSMPRMNLIINDTSFKKAGYGNGYGYGYGSYGNEAG